MFNGTLFTEDFLVEGIQQTATFQANASDVARVRARCRAIFEAVRDPAKLNEAQVEDRLIKPVLDVLGWTNEVRSVQERAEAKSRKNVPDYLFFPDEAAFRAADGKGVTERYKRAIVVGDAKAWKIDLDKRGGGAGEDETPSAQLLRYMDRASAMSDRNVRFGLLTNGRYWRLYYQDAKSRLEDYLEIDLAWAAGMKGVQPRLLLAAPKERLGGRTPEDHALILFCTLFSRTSFDSNAEAGRSVHVNALEEGRRWEARVRETLAETVFTDVFPGLVRALVAHDKRVPSDAMLLADAREGALILLYRLLFALYAEDRDLLPRRDLSFEQYSLTHLREEIADHIEKGQAYSSRGTEIWNHIETLFRLIDEGDTALGLPPYNGGLFESTRAGLLASVRPDDARLAPLIDALSRTDKDGRRVLINYRDLSVRELGSIYERLLEYEPVEDADSPDGVKVRLNPFARKGSGSYYTPDVLVRLVIERTLEPLITERKEAFRKGLERKAEKMELTKLDPASAILTIKACDPAMGSGHFLVALVDWLADRASTSIEQAEADAREAGYKNWQSPLRDELAKLREGVEEEAKANKWKLEQEQLADRNLIKRFVLKRCIYGVDKNDMAVELAKVALWLHTFTAGAPLSFLDHHLRCGDSLFGETVRGVLDELQERGTLLISDAVRKAEAAVSAMQVIERLSDARLADVQESERQFADLEARTRPLARFFDIWHALRWLDPKGADLRARDAWLDGAFGDPIAIAAGEADLLKPAGVPDDTQIDLALLEDEPAQLDLLGRSLSGSAVDYVRARALLARARALADEQHFLHWQVAFPGVWTKWSSIEPEGGFDAVVGNPPWDRMKMQEVEWFAARAPDIAREPRAADRKTAIAALRSTRDPLVEAYDHASARAERAMEVARVSGEYPLLSRGDINIYSLFVERAGALIGATGLVGLLTPIGIGTDRTSADFFSRMAEEKRVALFLAFENRRGWLFSDVHHEDQPTIIVLGGRSRSFNDFGFGVKLHEIPNDDYIASHRLTATVCRNINPNTGTVPIFRSLRDAEITRAIYERLPVLVDRSSGTELKAWPVRYSTMFHMTNDSHLFWTRERLEKEGAYAVDGRHWKNSKSVWMPLFEGKMITIFNHRYASVDVNPSSISGQGVAVHTDNSQLLNPNFANYPRYWVQENLITYAFPFALGFNDICNTNNRRSLIASIVPRAAYGNKLPILIPDAGADTETLVYLVGNLNSLVADYVARQKIQSRNLNKYILEQLPIVPLAVYSKVFGTKTAGEIVKDHVLRLSYTAHDLADFGCDMGHIDKQGNVLPPFKWDEIERRHLSARLDALYFHLYGVTDEHDVRYVLSTFPILERENREQFDGVYLTLELIIWYMRALAAGDVDRIAPEAQIVADSKRRS